MVPLSHNEPMNFETVVFDYNGTLIDDTDLCHELLNKLLTLRGHPTVTRERYLDIFQFPIKSYYVAAGFDFATGRDEYEPLARIFTDDYLARYPKECHLFDDVISSFQSLKGKELLVISATDQQYLDEELKHYGIWEYLTAAVGIKGIEINSKLKEAVSYFSNHPHDMEKVLFVGDTDHDVEVARAIGARIALISRGHQSIERLQKAKPNFIFGSIEEMVKNLF